MLTDIFEADIPHQRISRVVYWCAFYGLIDKVVLYLDSHLSPMIRCHKNRSIFSGAILGGQLEVAKLILSKQYVETENNTRDLKTLMLSDQDLDQNTPLHHAYTKHSPDLRRLIRQYAGQELTNQLKHTRNLRAKTPDEMLHL